MTLTTSSRLDKREKGAQEATLLRGVPEVTGARSGPACLALLRGVPHLAIFSGHSNCETALELPILPRWR
jgi:hypothetical protein